MIDDAKLTSDVMDIRVATSTEINSNNGVRELRPTLSKSNITASKVRKPCFMIRLSTIIFQKRTSPPQSNLGK